MAVHLRHLCQQHTMHAGEQKFESLQYKVAMAEVSHLHFAAKPRDDQAAA
jgi:hypothetical protein